MGSNEHYPEERPMRRVAVEGFWMDRGPVVKAAFGRFEHQGRVKAQCHRSRGSLLFCARQGAVSQARKLLLRRCATPISN